MASTTSLLLKLFSGQLNKEIVFKKYGDKTIVSVYPDMSKRKLTVAQKEAQRVMARAVSKAKKVMKDEILSAEAQVRLNVTTNRLYTALIKEYFATVKAEKEGGIKEEEID